MDPSKVVTLNYLDRRLAELTFRIFIALAIQAVVVVGIVFWMLG